jgi:iron(III) transport system permease protein
MAPVARAPAPPWSRPARADLAVVATAATVLALLLVFVVWPVVRVVAASVTTADGVGLGQYVAFFGTWRLLRVLLNSLVASAVSTTLTMAVALVLAWAVTRTTVPGRRVLSLVSLLPLISPPFLVSLGLILLLGRDGAVTGALGLDWSIEGMHGIVLAQVLTFLPQACVQLGGVLGSVDTSLEEAAESLGAGTLTTLRRVTLALARPGLASAALVVFILCMTDFGNPLLVGGRYDVLTTEIYARVVGTQDLPAGAVMSVVLLVPCLLASLAGTFVLKGHSSVTVSAGRRPTPRPTPTALRWPLLALSGAIALGIAAIYALIPLGSLVRLWGSDWSLSLVHYGFRSTGEGAWPLWNSVKLALLSGAAGTVLALLTAYVVQRRRPPGAAVIGALSLLPVALPGTVVGVGYVLAFGVPPLLLAGTTWILVASVVFSKFPAAVLAASNTLRQVDPAVEQAAVSLGAGAARTLARVVLPLLTETAVSIFVYFFVNGMVTVAAVIFLVDPGVSLGSVAMLARVEHGDLGVACALGTSIVVIVVGALLLRRALTGPDGMAILNS